MADRLRVDSIIATTAAGSGHPTSCMSCAEIMSTLFFNTITKDDDFILSKGHAVPILWSVYAEAGIISQAKLKTLRKISSNLEGHPTPNMPYIQVATGSLGQGLSAGLGMALAKTKGKTFVLLGDSESTEGSVWEAANTAAYYKTKNLIAIIDVNRLGQSQETMHGHKIRVYKKKFKAFGWKAVSINGHSIKQILWALKLARKSKKPFAIIAKTYKGKGVSFLENKEGWHGKALSKDEAKLAIEEINPQKIKLKSQIKKPKVNYKRSNFKLNNYELKEEVATRDAFGKALVNAGKTNNKIITIDGEVRNSTKTEEFFKKFPKRSFESFIAEQNMVGMALGFSTQGFTPVVATFGTFFTRAFDFIRMANYSKANIKFVGSHVGVHIGEDGPSQMGLEDISMFLSVPNSTILYPSDAPSTEYLTKEMLNLKGISYLRTTRGTTPVIYSEKEKFPVGKFKVVKKSKSDKVLIIAAGITLHESLKAYEILQKKKINVRIIDLYSIRPLDSKNLIKNAKECKNKVIVVEDHYPYGISAVITEILGKVTSLNIKETPRSGDPDKLLKKYQIDSSTIIKTVEKLK